MTKPLSYCTFA